MNTRTAETVPSFRRKVLSALFWTGSARATTQIVTWAVTIFVIRLLTPEDYGLIAMAMVFVNIMTLMADAGLGSALVQTTEIDESKLRTIFGASIVVGALLFAILVAAAPAIATFFHEDRLTSIIATLATQFLISIFGVIPTALLARELDFKRPSIIDFVAAVCGSLVTLALAIAGRGVWALVIGNLFAMALRTIGLNLVSPFLKRPTFSIGKARELITFGGQVTGARLLRYLYSQADIVVAGKLLGKELLGFYSVSMDLASLPVQRISSIINQVAFPAFARSQHDQELVAEYVLKSCGVLSFVSFPVLWGIASIAPQIVSVLLGPKWEAAVIPLSLLPLVMPLSLLSTFLNTAFQGIGQSSVVLKNVFTACLIMPLAFVIGAGWGLKGLCLAWVFGFPVVLILNFRRMFPLVGIKAGTLFLAIARSALPAFLMYSLVTALRFFAAGQLAQAPLMGMLISVGIITYVSLAWLLNRKGVMEFVALFNVRRAP